MTMNELATLLKTYRKKSGLTQKQLSGRINFNHTVISRAENPESNYMPTLAYIQQFCLSMELDDQETNQINAAYEQALKNREQHSMMNDRGSTLEPINRDLKIPDPSVLPSGDRQKNWYQKYRARTPLIGLLLILLFAFFFFPREQFLAQDYSSIVPPGTVLYSENFESRKIGDWEFLNPGKWQVFDRNGSAVFGVINPDPEAIPNAFLTRSVKWENYSVKTDVAFQSGKYEQIYIVVRNAGRKNNCSGYRVGGNRLGISIFRFELRGDCLGEVLSENSEYPLNSGQTYHMKVEVQGPDIRFFINDKLVLQATDAHYPDGGIGLLAYQVEWASFDNFQVEKR